jgi:hypothetical protein
LQAEITDGLADIHGYAINSKPKKRWVHSNQSSTVWQVEIAGLPAGASFTNVLGKWLANATVYS